MAQSHGQSSGESIPVSAYIAIFAAIASISAAAILIRFALSETMPPLLIACARLFVASVVLTPIALRRYIHHIQSLTRFELLLAGVSGLFLAIHFMAWVSSLQFTTVLVSVVIVTTGPIWVAILEVAFLRLRLSSLIIIGLLIALAGGILIGLPLGDSSTAISNAVRQDTNLTGAFLAWVGALAVSVYMLIGRKLRRTLPVIPYIWLVYSIATIVLLCVLLVTQTQITGYSSVGYMILLAMGLVPQLIGHSSINYVLEYFPATLVSMFTQLEPIGSAILAYIFLAEIPPSQQIIGSGIILCGVLIASRGEATESTEKTKNNSS